MEFLKAAQPYLGVILLQFGYAGSAVIAKSALNKGMSHYAFSIYRNLFAAFVFAPFAAVIERKVRPRMTFSVLYKILLLALLEPVIDQNLYYAAMKYTTATFAAAMTNMLPALTFLLAWILRLEQVNIRSIRSLAKVGGTIITVGGAMILTLVTGPVIGLPWTTSSKADHDDVNHVGQSTINAQDPIKGAVMITAGCICWASFYNLQAITLKSYPACLSLTSMICTAGALLNMVLTLVVERGNPRVWSLHLDIILLSYFYSGMVTSGVGYYISGRIMRVKGPVFVTAFNPIAMVIVAIMSSFILNEQLRFGRVFGGITIVVGLYLVVWGKCNDQSLSSKSNTVIIDDHDHDEQSPSPADRNLKLNDGKGTEAAKPINVNIAAADNIINAV